jgi:hypothetical protein
VRDLGVLRLFAADARCGFCASTLPAPSPRFDHGHATAARRSCDLRFRRPAVLFEELEDETRQRSTTMETAILNEIRDLGGRLERVAGRVGDVEGRLGPE